MFVNLKYGGRVKMVEKRFYVAESNLTDGYCVFDREKKYAFTPRPRKADCLNDAHTFNELSEENEQLKSKNNKFKEENKGIKQLIHRMLVQMDIDKINTENARYSARIIFTLEEFQKMRQIWKGE